MRAMLLAFAFLVIASRAALGEIPTYELFVIEPDQIIKTTVTTHGDWDNLEVTVSKPTATALLAFTERNLGRVAMIGLLQLNKSGDRGTINLTHVFLKAPIRDGIVHLTLPSRKGTTRGLLAD